MIESLDNKQIKLMHKLKQKKYREKEQQFVIEGIHLVEMALLHDRALCVFLTEAYQVIDDEKVYKDDQFIMNLSCPYEYISGKVAKKLADTVASQAIFALCEMRQQRYDGTSIILFDGLQDPGNVGTIIRTANAFNIHNFYFSADAVDPYNDKAVRASQGAIFLSNLFSATDTADILPEVKALKHIFALDITGEPLTGIRAPQSAFALIVGNEAQGITYDRWQQLGVQQVTIPMKAEIDSLNVAVATSIAIYALQH